LPSRNVHINNTKKRAKSTQLHGYSITIKERFVNTAATPVSGANQASKTNFFTIIFMPKSL